MKICFKKPFNVSKQRDYDPAKDIKDIAANDMELEALAAAMIAKVKDKVGELAVLSTKFVRVDLLALQIAKGFSSII